LVQCILFYFAYAKSKTGVIVLIKTVKYEKKFGNLMTSNMDKVRFPVVRH